MRSLGPRYNRLFGATLVSNLGDGVGRTAMPLLAASLTRDPVLVGGLTASLFLPWLLLALPAGALVDRVDRRLAFARASAFRAIVLIVLTVAVATDAVSIWMLYALAFILGAGETVSDSAAQAMLPSVVDDDQLDIANGRLQAAIIVSDGFIGAPVGGFLFAAAAAAPFALNAAGFLLAAALIMAVAGSFHPAAGADRTRLRTEIGDGLRWLAGHRFVRNLTMLAGMLGLLNAATSAVLVLFALEKLGLDERGFGLFLTAAAAGGLLGGVTAARVCAWLGRVARSPSPLPVRVSPCSGLA